MRLILCSTNSKFLLKFHTMSINIQDKSIIFHKKYRGKIRTQLHVPLDTKEDLSMAYTPGVAGVSSLLAKNKEMTNDHTWRGRCVAVVSDGSAVLGLGNIGPDGAYPVMEGKCALFKRFAGLDAVPILLSTQNPDEIISAIVAISPSFGAINLEDIASPKCFYIESTLKKKLKIPIIHDDQWGTSVVVLAGLINACKVVKKNVREANIVVNGAGAAGSAIVKILHKYGAKNIISCDSQGIIHKNRIGITPEKSILADITNPNGQSGNLEDAVIGADILIGVSKPNIFKASMIRTMKPSPVVFALANPTPEIMPDIAKSGGVTIIATGRSDFPNQINNALSFPGIFKGLLENNVKNVTMSMLIAGAESLAALVKKPTADNIIPSIFDKRVVPAIVRGIRKVPSTPGP